MRTRVCLWDYAAAILSTFNDVAEMKKQFPKRDRMEGNLKSWFSYEGDLATAIFQNLFADFVFTYVNWENKIS